MQFTIELAGHKTHLHLRQDESLSVNDGVGLAIHPEERAALESILSRGQPADLPDFRLSSGNEAAWVTGFFDPAAEPALNLFSIDRRRSSQLEQEEIGERLALVLEGTRLGMWDWNPQTNEVVFDQRWAEMLGHDLSEIEFSLSSWESRVHPDDLAACYADIGAHINGETDFYENVHRMRHRDGHWVYILDRGKVTTRDADGKPIRFTGTHTDITREKAAELKAREALTAKDFFLARMSHEIRTPLHGVLGFTELLRRSELNPEQNEYLEIIGRSSKSLLTILNDILDLARVESGKLRLDPVVFDVHRTIKDCFLLFKETAIRKELTFQLRMEPELPRHVRGDENRIRQVLSNLVNNALKFTDTGSVVLDVSRDGETSAPDRLLIRVTDTGPGIEIDQQKQIFEKFSQMSDPASRKHGGAGLGLSICKELVELMGGAIGVDSQPGSGSTFFVRLPLREESPPAPQPTPVSESFAGIKVLIAEDDETNQILLGRFLEKMAVNGTFVSNGQEALDQLGHSVFDFLFLDLHMPVLNGLETMKALDNSDLRKPYVVALTADAFPETREACLKVGMDDFLTKPYSFDQLKRVLARPTPDG